MAVTRKTKLSYLIELPKIVDEGYLCFAEVGKHLPFKIKRFYYIFDILKNAQRGFHAHKKTQQALFCIRGSVVVTLDNGHKREEILFTEPNKGIFLNQMVWHEMKEMSKDAVLLIAASEIYKESDYIRDYTLFLKLARKESK